MLNKFTNRLRAEFVVKRLSGSDNVRLNDLCWHFQISRATASKAIQQFLADYPDAIAYDKSAKCFVRGLAFNQHRQQLEAK